MYFGKAAEVAQLLVGSQWVSDRCSSAGKSNLQVFAASFSNDLDTSPGGFWTKARENYNYNWTQSQVTTVFYLSD